MRDHTSPIFKELASTGADTLSITPSTGEQAATFSISGVPPVTGDMRNYAQAFWVHVSLTLDPDAAGNAVSFDKLYKALASARLHGPLVGDVYPHSHTRGPVLGHIIQVFAYGYSYPQPARAQIPASTDSDVTIDLYYCLPLSWECLAKPHETAQWVGFFDGGTVEAVLEPSSVFDGDYAGAVYKAPTTVRAYVEMLPSPDIFLGVPFQWRERVITGGGTAPVLKGVGQETSMLGLEQGAGLVAMLWLTNATGIGLDGPDGVDNLTSIEVPWRGQPTLRNLDPYFLALRKATRRRVGPVAGTGTTIVHDGAGWPFTMEAAPNNRLAANSQAMFLPIVVPGLEFETSKAQRVLGDLSVTFGVTDAISAAHRFVTWELMEFGEPQIERMARAMGVDLNLFVAHRKALRDNAPDASKLRYTRIEFLPRPEAVAAATV